MLFKATYNEAIGETRIELSSNTYTDALPMLRHILFRKTPIDRAAQCLPLATAILTRRYVGDVFEYAGFKIGSEYADAIRSLLIPRANVVNVDGLNRAFSTAEIDVMVGKAGKAAPMPMHSGRVPLARVDWSGDFVDPATRNSSQFAFGAVQTNAQFFADPFSVSVAVGLLFGRDRCGDLIVSTPATDERQYREIAEALRIVGVTLEGRVEVPEPASVGLGLRNTRLQSSAFQ